MAFRHIAMFRFAPGVNDSTITEISTALSSLPDQIPEIVRYVHGRDAALSPGAFDYAVVADFANADDWVTYRDHPVHQRLISELVVGNVSERAAIQFDYDAS